MSFAQLFFAFRVPKQATQHLRIFPLFPILYFPYAYRVILWYDRGIKWA